MRIALLGPSADLERVKSAAAIIEAAGHTIAEPWWTRIEADRGGRPTDVGVPTRILAASWERNTDGIFTAQRVIALARVGGGLSDGTREELAFAASFATTIRVVGDPGFSPLAGWLRSRNCVVTTIEEALRP